MWRGCALVVGGWLLFGVFGSTPVVVERGEGPLYLLGLSAALVGEGVHLVAVLGDGGADEAGVGEVVDAAIDARVGYTPGGAPLHGVAELAVPHVAVFEQADQHERVPGLTEQVFEFVQPSQIVHRVPPGVVPPRRWSTERAVRLTLRRSHST